MASPRQPSAPPVALSRDRAATLLAALEAGLVERGPIVRLARLTAPRRARLRRRPAARRDFLERFDRYTLRGGG